MRRSARAAALAVTGLLVALWCAPAGAEPTDPVPSTSPTPSPSATAVPDGAFSVDDAVLRWGVNNESNNRGAAPGTFNFFSAGKLGDPRTGGQLLTDASAGAKWANGRNAGWTPTAGNVRIEKLRADNSFGTATWAGLKTDRDGVVLGGYAVNTKFSDHQVVVGGGTGTVDPTTRTATMRWTGSFTVVFYSGYSFFYVTDPVLTVTKGTGKLTATLGGYSSSMDDLTQWKAVPDRKNVVLADLGAVDLGRKLGFTATPKYLGVKVTGADQNTRGNYTGAFPQSFVDFAGSVGIAGYWVSTGGGVDRNKPALDVAIGYAAGSPVIPETPTGRGSPAPSIANSAPPPPPRRAPSPPATTSTTSTATQPPGPVLPVQPAASGAATAQAAAALAAPIDVTSVRPVSTVLAADSPKAAAARTARAPAWPYIAGVLALLLAGLVTAAPAVTKKLRKPAPEGNA